MEYIIWVPAILGLLAFLSIGGLRARISRLEDQLGSMKGSPVHVEKLALMKLLKEYEGKFVELEFRGEQYDADLCIPGSKCTVQSVDEEWVLVHITNKNTDKEKIFRLQQISSVKGIA